MYNLLNTGAGSTLGAGLYVLPGQVSRELTGPAIIISFIAAGLIAGLAGNYDSEILFLIFPFLLG